MIAETAAPDAIMLIAVVKPQSLGSFFVSENNLIIIINISEDILIIFFPTLLINILCIMLPVNMAVADGSPSAPAAEMSANDATPPIFVSARRKPVINDAVNITTDPAILFF